MFGDLLDEAKSPVPSLLIPYKDGETEIILMMSIFLKLEIDLEIRLEV